MDQLNYSIPVKERLEFEREYQAELARQWAPFRGYYLLRGTFAVAAALLFFLAIPQPERALAAFAVACFLFWGFQAAIQKLTEEYHQRFLESLPEVEQYRSYIEGDRIYTVNRGYQVGFPLSAMSKAYVKAGFIFMDFPNLGRLRIPISAFDDDTTLEEFKKTLKKYKKHAN